MVRPTSEFDRTVARFQTNHGWNPRDSQPLVAWPLAAKIWPDSDRIMVEILAIRGHWQSRIHSISVEFWPKSRRRRPLYEFYAARTAAVQLTVIAGIYSRWRRNYNQISRWTLGVSAGVIPTGFWLEPSQKHLDFDLPSPRVGHTPIDCHADCDRHRPKIRSPEHLVSRNMAGVDRNLVGCRPRSGRRRRCRVHERRRVYCHARE